MTACKRMIKKGLDTAEKKRSLSSDIRKWQESKALAFEKKLIKRSQSYNLTLFY